MKDLLLIAFTCLMPLLLYSDPCPDDTTPPVIESRGEVWDCTFNVLEDSDTNFITVTEESECGLRIVEIADWDLVKGDCEDGFIKQYTIVWYAEDMAGNVANFTQVITIERPSTVDIVFPADTMIQCPASGYDDQELFGAPSINGKNLTDMCGLRVKYNILDTLPAMTSEQCLTEVRKEWIVIENCSGLILRDTQNIILIDTIRPIIACTALEDTVTLVIDTETCCAIYSFPETDAIDFCAPDEELVFRYRIDGAASGREVALKAGIYEGSVVVTDPCNNSDTCYYAIVVLDDSAPSIDCTEPDTIVLTEAEQVIDATQLGFTANECTGEVDLVYRFSSQAPGSEASAQTFNCDMINSTISVTIIATDTSGNVSDPVICDIYVTSAAEVCAQAREVAGTSPSRAEAEVRNPARVYYNGQQLVLESESGISALALYNLSGEMVWEKHWSESRNQFQGNLPVKIQDGIYLLKIRKESGLVENAKLAVF